MSDHGFKRLSAAVVVEAYQDATGTRLSLTGAPSPRAKGTEHQRGARKFLESDGLDMWCSVLDMDPAAIRDKLPSDCHTTCSDE
jgi:hypothetical protein